MTFDDRIIPHKDLINEDNLEEAIKDLLKKEYEKWEWENPGDLSLEDPSCPISVITNFRAGAAGTQGPYFKKKDEFTKQMATVLDDYGCTIVNPVKDETSIDSQYRRIDIFYKLKSRN
jgi:hypothetical protein